MFYHMVFLSVRIIDLQLPSRWISNFSSVVLLSIRIIDIWLCYFWVMIFLLWQFLIARMVNLRLPFFLSTAPYYNYHILYLFTVISSKLITLANTLVYHTSFRIHPWLIFLIQVGTCSTILSWKKECQYDFR